MWGQTDRKLLILRILHMRGRRGLSKEIRPSLQQSTLELGGYGAVDEKIRGEVEHNKEMSHRLEAHDP